MTEIGADFSQLDKFSTKFTRFLPRWRRYHAVAMDEIVNDLYDLVRQQASGRPGPQVVTGRYLGSIKKSATRVFSDHPAGPRLEFGFSGRDRLGRDYHQPPFPHWRPAAARMRKQFPRQLRRVVIDVWRDT